MLALGRGLFLDLSVWLNLSNHVRGPGRCVEIVQKRLSTSSQDKRLSMLPDDATVKMVQVLTNPPHICIDVVRSELIMIFGGRSSMD